MPLANTAATVRHREYNTAKIIKSFSVAQTILLSERKHIKTSAALTLITERAQALYFALLSSSESCRRLSECHNPNILAAAERLAVNALSLMQYHPKLSKDRKIHTRKLSLINADITAFCESARTAKFQTLTACGSITRALPEIEYICKCEDAAHKAHRLVKLL